MSNDELSVTGWSFPPEFKNQGSDVVLVSDELEIKQALEILFSTEIQERLQHPEFGCDLKSFLFSEVNNNLVIEIKDMIVNAVYTHEPRIELQNVSITESENNAHLLLIELEYTILETGNLETIVYPLSIFG